ncbi:MAG: hypothetical protein ACKOU6_11740 [Planctomycetota bacterium]
MREAEPTPAAATRCHHRGATIEAATNRVDHNCKWRYSNVTVYHGSNRRLLRSLIRHLHSAASS